MFAGEMPESQDLDGRTVWFRDPGLCCTRGSSLLQGLGNDSAQARPPVRGLYLITGSSNSRPILKIDPNLFREPGRFGHPVSYPA